MPVIHLKNLQKSYGSIRVIHGIDLIMEENEFTVFVGPSGCGKSTTLRMIAGLETVSGGEILMGDKDVSQLEPINRDIAMVFQDYALYPHMNVAKNMSFGLRLAKYPKDEIEKRIQKVSKMLGLDTLLGRKPGALSGGQRQRVAMGRALVRDSSTLLMDEPLSNLDAKLRGQMRAELSIMRDNIQKNIIYVTHDQVEAMTLGDRIVVMNGGYIQQHGSPQELFKRPYNKFVAGFIGMPPMNFINAEIVSENDTLIAKGDGFTLSLPPIENIDQLSESRQIIVGIRPSAFTVTQNLEQEQPNTITANIKVCEYIGSQSVLLSDVNNSRITIEASSEHNIKAGDTASFKIDSKDIYLFNKKTELAIY